MAETEKYVLYSVNELKKKLGELVEAIVQEEGQQEPQNGSLVRNLREAEEILNALGGGDNPCADAGLNKPCSQKMGFNLLTYLMKQQIYNVAKMQAWLRQRNQRRRLRNELFSELVVPTKTIHRIIINEHMKHYYQTQKMQTWLRQRNKRHHPGDETFVELREHVNVFYGLLLGIISDPRTEQITAARELKQRTSQLSAYRALFGKIPDAISTLVLPLSDSNVASDPELQLEVMATLLHLSKHNDNRELAVKTDHVVRILVQSLQIGNTSATKGIAALVLCELAKGGDSSRAVIGQSGAIKSLINLLGGEVFVRKNACAAIFELCYLKENQRKVRCNLNDVNVEEFVNGLRSLLEENTVTLEDLSENGVYPVLEEISLRLSYTAWDKCATLLDDIEAAVKQKKRPLKKRRTNSR